MKVITAPETLTDEYFELNGILVPAIKLFLAGGITNCDNWQDKVIKYLDDHYADSTEGLILYNPRRTDFPIHDPNASKKQISWEFNALENCDIFSMYFCAGDSDQPICMYELGRNLVRMEQKFHDDTINRILVSVEDGYRRKQDVEIQTKLTGIGVSLNINNEGEDKITPESHAECIYIMYQALMIDLKNKYLL